MSSTPFTKTKNNMKTFLKNWAMMAVPFILLTYFGFIFIGGGINPLEWAEVDRENFGVWIIIFGFLSGAIAAATILDPK